MDNFVESALLLIFVIKFSCSKITLFLSFSCALYSPDTGSEEASAMPGLALTAQRESK